MTDLLALALSALNAGDCPQAFRLLTALLLAEPGNAVGWFNLGGLQERLMQWPAAVASFRRSDELAPGNPATLMALGWHLHLAGRTAEAEPILRRVIGLAPEMALGHTNLSHVLATLGRDEESLGYAMRAYDLDPATPLVRLGLAFGMFFAKRWREGWEAFEARIAIKMPEMFQYPYPRWGGGRVAALFLCGEQGLGDTLMMARYFDAVAEMADRVILHVQAPLVGLMRELHPDWDVVGQPAVLPVGVDAYCPLMSLPRYVGDADEPFWDGPYVPRRLAARASLVERQTARTASVAHGVRGPRRVGLAWAGDPAHANDGHRSVPLSEMLRLTEIGGTEFVSLQVGPRGTKEIDACAAHALVRDMAPEIGDMRDTARVLDGLDLLICVDTGVGHLAGAMGLPTWLLVNQRGCDWRHGRTQEHSDWYPSVRLFRRSLDEQWSDVLCRVATELGNQTAKLSLAA